MAFNLRPVVTVLTVVTTILTASLYLHIFTSSHVARPIPQPFEPGARYSPADEPTPLSYKPAQEMIALMDRASQSAEQTLDSSVRDLEFSVDSPFGEETTALIRSMRSTLAEIAYPGIYIDLSSCDLSMRFLEACSGWSAGTYAIASSVQSAYQHAATRSLLCAKGMNKVPLQLARLERYRSQILASPLLFSGTHAILQHSSPISEQHQEHLLSSFETFQNQVGDFASSLTHLQQAAEGSEVDYHTTMLHKFRSEMASNYLVVAEQAKTPELLDHKFFSDYSYACKQLLRDRELGIAGVVIVV